MHAHNLPNLSTNLARTLAPPRLFAGVLLSLALLTAACSTDTNGPLSPTLLAAKMSNLAASSASAASSAPSLGAAASFAVLGGTSVTCTGSSVTGDVGVSPGTSVTGFPPTSTLCTLAGTVHAGDATAALAHNAFVIAYDALKGMTCDPANNLTGQDLGGKSLAPGVYCFNTTAGLTGQLTLTGSGPWIFQIGTGLTTGSGATGPASVVMAGGDPCNVFWQVGSQATIGTNTAFQGNILAGTAIVFSGTGSSLVGRALAKAEVTMTGTNVSLGNCGGGGAGTPPPCKQRGDRVTGGGWIIGQSREKATFAVSGGIDVKKNAFRGQLEYEDKASKGKRDDVKVKGTGATSYIALDALTRRIEGTAKVNGKAGFTYRVDATDNGEPGRKDVFAISIWNASGTLIYSASGTLGGGNIQLHSARGRSCDKDGDDDHGHRHGDNGHGDNSHGDNGHSDNGHGDDDHGGEGHKGGST